MKQLLLDLEACHDAKFWANGKSWKEVFETCHRGDWLLWLFYCTATSSEDDFALLTIAKGHCANTVRHLMKNDASIKAVDCAMNYSGDRTVLKAAYSAAFISSNFAADAYSDYPASSWRAAAYSSAAAAAAAADARAHSNAAADAYSALSYDGAYSAAREINQKQTADIVRKYIPIEKWNIDINLKS